MNETTRFHDRPGMKEADEAMTRMQDRGYVFFRNGRIVSPNGHAITDEDRADFGLVKAVYRHSLLC